MANFEVSTLAARATAHAFAHYPALVDSVLAAGSSSSTNTGDGEDHKAGPWGLGIVLILCIACYFLFRSMARHLRTVREDFPVEQTVPQTGQADATSPVAPGSTATTTSNTP